MDRKARAEQGTSTVPPERSEDQEVDAGTARRQRRQERARARLREGRQAVYDSIDDVIRSCRLWRQDLADAIEEVHDPVYRTSCLQTDERLQELIAALVDMRAVIRAASSDALGHGA